MTLPLELKDAEEQVYTTCTMGGPLLVHVKNDKIVRIRPLPLTEDDVKSARWKITVGDKTFQPPTRTTTTPYGLGFRGRIYASSRLKYPMKRVGFEPGGKGTIENRGKGEFVRIGWNEATDIVAQEITRIKETYGPSAVLGWNSLHHMWGTLHHYATTFRRFLNLLGATRQMDNPVSWEGWWWGGVHAWGFQSNLSIPDQSDLLEDIMKNCELLIFWSCDPETTWGYAGQDSLLWRLWLRELGIKQVFIDPYCNFTARRFAHKWIAPRPATDPALAAAIAYVWFTEETYDKDYVATHTYGFDKWKEYILGDADGIPKTPEWAEYISGVEARVIRALAREWASKRTTISIKGGMGGACRTTNGTEWARMMVILQAMQGLGKPGVTIWDSQSGVPANTDFYFPSYVPSPLELTAQKKSENPVQQHIYRLLVPEGILTPPIQWTGAGTECVMLGADYQFKKYAYPEPGQADVKMLYRYGGSNFGTIPQGNKWAEMYKSPKLEFIVGQTPWMEPESNFADVLLPACTLFEKNDISEWSNAPFSMWDCNYRVVVYHQKCIDPLYESKSDLEIFTLLAEKLGFKDEYTEGNTEDDWIRKIYEISSMPQHMSYEEFKEKGYFVVPMPNDYKPKTAFRRFYQTGEGLDTPSGKIEFLSQRLQKYLPDDKERPPVPHYVPSWEGHTTSSLVHKYPLQLMVPHARYTFHTQGDEEGSWIRDIWMHRVLKNGYSYWPIQIHPIDARARGINNGDIVKVYNDRATVLLIARVTEMIRPGIVLARTAGRYDPVEPGNPNSLDRGGAVNLLVSSRFMSPNVPAQVNQCLVQLEKWEG